MTPLPRSVLLRTLTRRIAAVLLSGTVIAGGFLGHRFAEQRAIHLHGSTVAVLPDGTVDIVAADTPLVPGSRVVAGAPESADLAAEQAQWLAAGRVPRVPGMAESTMINDALLDLHVLDRSHGVTTAGWSPNWRYVWPRDSAFVATAYARTGHLDEAVAQLRFLQEVQPDSGQFDARYLPDGSGVPDDRGVQLDGAGWALWALAQVVAEQPSAQARRDLLAEFQPLHDRSLAAIRTSTEAGTTLPPPSSDYWEVTEHRPTLATAAVLLAGLRGSQQLASQLPSGTPGETARLADTFEATVLDAFVGSGFPRHPGGSARSVDLGVAFLMPPFASVSDDRVEEAFERLPTAMARPAGGLSPGGAWRNDGISWTPTTATVALVAACTDRQAALDWLRWLDAHRTAAGSLPEKVLADGSPASVVPLSWTAAAVVITADTLQDGCR